MQSGNFLTRPVDEIRFRIRRFKALRRLHQFHDKPRTIEETIDWALNFGTRKEFSIHTIQIRDEILALARTVSALEPRIILEIGTAFGGTLLIWSQLASELVISCDLVDKSVQSDLYRKFPPPGSRCTVEILTGDSHSLDFRQRVAGVLGGRKVDFLFIDGDHSEAGVAADYHGYRDLVRPGGIIAFHDIVEKQISPNSRVYHFWNRLRQDADTEEYVKDRNQVGYGIGVIRVPHQ